MFDENYFCQFIILHRSKHTNQTVKITHHHIHGTEQNIYIVNFQVKILI